MSHKLGEILERNNFLSLADFVNSEIDYRNMGEKTRTELARRIIEMSASRPDIVNFCINKDSQNVIGMNLLISTHLLISQNSNKLSTFGRIDVSCGT